MSFNNSTYIPLLTERGILGCRGYKHFASPEQDPRNTKELFVQSLTTDYSALFLVALNESIKNDAINAEADK